MGLFIEDVLDVHSIAAIRDALEDDKLFESGERTARGSAKLVKNNVQAKKEGLAKGALKMVEAALSKNDTLRSAAIPEKFAKVMFNRYDEGMSYGEHVDDAYIAGVRTDLSFTLFLTDPDTYEGGELVIKRDDGNESVKLPAGSLYLYPANHIHFIEPVRSGSRLCAVGWIQSKVRLAEHRQILFDLKRAMTGLAKDEPSRAARLKLQNVHNNLLRLWAGD